MVKNNVVSVGIEDFTGAARPILDGFLHEWHALRLEFRAGGLDVFDGQRDRPARSRVGEFDTAVQGKSCVAAVELRPLPLFAVEVREKLEMRSEGADGRSGVFTAA